MSRNTLQKYLPLLGKYVQEKVKKNLPPYFILMFDGSSIGTDHYLRVFRVLSSSSVEENVKYKITMVLS